MRFAVEQIGDATPTVAIYALCEYPSWEPRYVGKTIQYIGERHKAHICKAARGSHLPVYRWLKKQIESPTARLAIKLLEYVQPGADWRDRERHWIETYRPSGRLLNLTNGGEGLHGHRFSDEHRARIAAGLRTGAHFNCQSCGEQFWRKRRDILRGNCRFCSRSCYARSLAGVSRPVSLECTTRGVAAAAAEKLARTNCKRGHALSGDNLFLTSSGARGCKACRKIHKATYRARGAHVS